MRSISRIGYQPQSPWRFWKSLALNLVCNLSWKDFLAGLATAALLSAVMVTYRFQAFPSYHVGDIAELDIKSPLELWLEDPPATEAKRIQAQSSVVAIFDYDESLLQRGEDSIRHTFSKGREILQKYETERRTKLPDRLDPRQYKTLWLEIQTSFEEGPPQRALLVFFRERFSNALEDRLVRLYLDVVRPGVLKSRETLIRHQQRGVRLRDLQTGHETPISDVYRFRDLSQARGLVRQRQLEFSDLSASERREIVSYLEEKVVPNVTFDAQETKRRGAEAASRVEVVQQRFKQGQVIIRRGDEVTPHTLRIIKELAQRSQPRGLVSRTFGIFSLIFLLLYAVWRYLNRLQVRHRKVRNHFVLFSLVLFVSLALSRILFDLADLITENLAIVSSKEPIHLYHAIPFVFGAILITLLVDTNIGILFLSLFSVLIGLYSGSIHLAAYVLVGGFAAIYGAKQYRDRTTILKVGLTIGVANMMAAAALDQLMPATPEMKLVMVKVTGGFLSGILAAMIASLLLPVLESLFNITTDIRLLELSNLDSPILRRMAVEAPGTYHHSIIVGTLAESGAEAIGANPLLVRVSAYYHDIGKISKPAYFVENQVYIQNKHESLSPQMSCLVIASHVKDGLEMAKHLQLPSRIKDMIPQHHGTRVMTYFYQKAKLDPRNAAQELKESDFRYPGPKPQSKEAAILMIADAVEAASRTLVDPTPPKIQGMVKRLINAIVADGQFDECDITLRDLDLIASSFFKILGGIFHHRIEYPGYDFSKNEEGDSTTTVLPTHSGIQ